MPRSCYPCPTHLKWSRTQAIKYLQYQIQECNNVNPTIHNCLLSFYAETGGENLLGNAYEANSSVIFVSNDVYTDFTICM